MILRRKVVRGSVVHRFANANRFAYHGARGVSRTASPADRSTNREGQLAAASGSRFGTGLRIVGGQVVGIGLGNRLGRNLIPGHASEKGPHHTGVGQAGEGETGAHDDGEGDPMEVLLENRENRAENDGDAGDDLNLAIERDGFLATHDGKGSRRAGERATFHIDDIGDSSR